MNRKQICQACPRYTHTHGMHFCGRPFTEAGILDASRAEMLLQAAWTIPSAVCPLGKWRKDDAQPIDLRAAVPGVVHSVLAPSRTRAERDDCLAICRACPQSFTTCSVLRCKMCGCGVRIKSGAGVCPLGLWGKPLELAAVEARLVALRAL